LTILFFTVFYDCNAQSLKTPQELFPKTVIIGTWVHENEPENRWQFTPNGICYWKDNNNIEDTFTYSISYTSPQCGHQVQTNGSQFYYLKLVSQENDEYCYQIGVDNETLSINYLGTSKYDLFNRE